jgi:signal transduction histidine kinase/ActR/RegA family two-component response regulator
MTNESLKAAPLPFRVLALVGGFVLLIAVVLAAGWFIALQEVDTDFVRRAFAIQQSVARTFSLLQDAETGQRGYLLTGDPAYLDPFSNAEAQFDREFDNLDRLIVNPAQKRAALTLRSIADDKRAVLRRTIALRRAGEVESALSIVQSGSGKALMDRARDVVATMQDAEATLLSASIEETRRNAVVIQAAIILAASLALLLALLSVYYLRAYLSNSFEAYRKLAAANDALAHEAIERDRLAAQLQQSQKLEVVGQLTGGIAHDFNNMLAVVIGNLELLRRRIAGGRTDVTRFMDGALDGAERAAALTQRLLAFSRQQPLSPAAIDANGLVSGMSELLRRSLGEGVAVETILAGGLWPIHVDAGQLESAIVNLAVNARDAMPEGGKLTIETGNSSLDEAYSKLHEEVQSGSYVLIAVSDTGVGMSRETIGKAFDPFFTTKASGKGTGLGLSQVYGFVKQSGGHVKIYSEPGHGTTIKLYLPRHFGALTKSAPPPLAAVLAAGSREEIVLVVEDDDRVRRFTVDALRDLNYTVLHADSAAEALLVLDNRPDVRLLLTDVVMPEMNGPQLVAEALHRRTDLRVLYFTGFTRNAIVHNGMLDPGVLLMTKPFTLQQLAAKVREALGAAVKARQDA